MKLNAFIAGIFGIIGFVLSVMAGLLVDNPVVTILFNALIWAGICYIAGYIIGGIAQQVSTEHAAALAKRVSDSDALREAREAEERANRDANEANNKMIGETVPGAPAVPGKI